MFRSLASCVFEIRPQLLTSVPANCTQRIFWRHLFSLIMTFIFKIVDFADFFDNSQPIRSKLEKSTSYSMFLTPWACYIPKMTFLTFTQKKLYIETSRKHPFSAQSTRLPTPEAKIGKNSYSLKFRQFSRFSPSLKIFPYKLLDPYFFEKKPRNSSLTAVKQMVGQSGTKVINDIDS